MAAKGKRNQRAGGAKTASAAKKSAARKPTAAKRKTAVIKKSSAARKSATAKKRAVSRKVTPVPEGHHTVNAHLWVRDGDRALAFYEKALGARVLVVKHAPGRKGVMHATMRIGDSVVMLADEWPGLHERAPATAGATTASLYCYVPNVDAVYTRAVQAGAEKMMPVEDMFWGDRMGKVKDPFGHVWFLSTRKEILSDAEVDRRAVAYFAKFQG